MIIERGTCHVYTKFEGNTFVIEELKEGSIINHRSFLREDNMYVNIQCQTNCSILKITDELFKNLQETHKSFGQSTKIV